MRIRRFGGRDVATALAAVKRAFGADAVILATRRLADGSIEVTAAVDVDTVTAPVAPPMEPPVPPAGEATAAVLGALTRELREVGARVQALDRALRPSATAGLGVEATVLVERLGLHGLAPALAAAIGADFEDAIRHGAAGSAALATSVARHLLRPAPPAAARVTAFVGPTGSGKTTTIAKLAAARVAAGEARVGLVMADGSRVGAAEQLGAYARLLGVPMRQARDAKELSAALAAFRDRDAVLVDTAGLGGDREAAAALTGLLGGGRDAVVVTAVLSAAASEGALRAAWRQLADLAPTSCVMTKLDEGAGAGPACSWAAEAGVSIAWLGTGQRVPADLRPATGDALARWLIAA